MLLAGMMVSAAATGSQAQTSESDFTQSNSSDLAELRQFQSSFQSIASKVAPAVVAISASTTANNSPDALRSADMNAEKLEAFLSHTTRMIGSGFVIDSDGFILTNDHVIDNAEQLWITTDDRKIYSAIVVGSDPRADLAVLKIPAHHMAVAHFGDGTSVQRGQWSIALGNPFALATDGQMCLSVGVVSAVNRSLVKLSDKENRSYTKLIQTTAQINPGNSGGPLVDLNGDVIGVNTAVILPQKSGNGVGFAVPITDRVRSIVQSLKRGDEVVYGYLGVIVTTATEDQSRNAKVAGAVCVDSVQLNSPAVNKLQPQDLIVAIDGRPTNDSQQFLEVISETAVNQPANVELLRAGNHRSVMVQLRKRELPVAAVTRGSERLRWDGLTLGHSSAGLAVLAVDDANSKVRRGAVIRSVLGQRVKDLIGFQNLINDESIQISDLKFDDASAVAAIDK